MKKGLLIYLLFGLLLLPTLGYVGTWPPAPTPASHSASHTDGTDDIQSATNAQKGLATANHIAAIEANTLKDTNVPTALSVGTVGADTVAITSDGGADDVILPAATVATAGMLTIAKWAEIVANNAKISTYTNLTSFVSQTAWRVFYSNADGDVVELALGADGTYLKSNGPAIAPTFATPAGGGDLKADGSVPLTANWDVGAYTLTGTQFISDISIGTAPFGCTSTTVVPNLNVSFLEGHGASYFQIADAALTSISGLTYVSPSFIKLTANDTYVVRTLAETRTDLNVEDGATADQSAAEVEISELGTATYDDVQDWINTTQSSGRISGGDLSSHVDVVTAVTVGGAGSGEFKVADDQTAGYPAAATITIYGSTNNDGDYTVSAGGSSHSAGTTTIPVDEAVAAVADGNIQNGRADVTAGTGFIKIIDSEVGETKTFDWSASNNIALIDLSTNHIHINYNAGSPVIQTTDDRDTIELNREFPLGMIYRNGTYTWPHTSGINLPNSIRLAHERLLATRGFERAKDGGGEISAYGTRNIQSTAGKFYLGDNKTTTTGKASATDKMTTVYYNGSAWVWTENQTAIDNTQYNNIASGLATLSNNKYGIHWVCIDFLSNLYVVYGQGDYTLTEAQVAGVPSLMPVIATDFGIVAAKIIIKKSDAAFTEVISAYTTLIPSASPATHNDLSGLDGGTAGEYYHMTSAQHAEATRKATPTQSGLITELATADEVATGTDNTRATTPLSLASKASKTTATISKTIGTTGDYATFAAAVAALPDLIAHAVTETIQTGTTLTEICTIKNKHGITSAGSITIQAEKYTDTAIQTADGATATTLNDASVFDTDDEWNSCWVLVVDGTGTDNGFVAITDTTGGATNTITVASWPGTQPDATSKYIIVGAMIDAVGSNYGMDLEANTVPITIKGIGVKTSSYGGFYNSKNTSTTYSYCGAYGNVRYGMDFFENIVSSVTHSGIVNNNTGDSVTYGGIGFRDGGKGGTNSCGISDNKQRGVLVKAGQYAAMYNNFGDLNGTWGTYAQNSGQANCSGTECSGTSGDHSNGAGDGSLAY